MDEEKTYSISSDVFERVKLIQRQDVIFVVVEPEEDIKSPFFVITAIDSKTGQIIKKLDISCRDTFNDVTYVGNYVVWTEADNLKWTPIDKKDVKSVSIKVSIIITLEKDA